MSHEPFHHAGVASDELSALLRIVNLVRRGEATTRPEIGRITGLGRGVVSQRVEEAIKLGYLEDGDIGPSSGGRAPRTLRFRGDRGRLLVCALGALHIHVGLVEINGDVIDHRHCDWDITRGPQDTLEQAEAMSSELIAANPGAPIWAVSIGVPGPVDFASGRPVAPPIMPGWNGFDVRGFFESRYEAPVWVDNDVNLLALGERAKHTNEMVDLVYCKVGTGVGAGLLSRGHIHRGANGAAGDIGHVPTQGRTAVCRCGKTGCLEAVAGGWALVRDAELGIEAGATGRLAESAANGQRLTPEAISLAAENGDALAISLVQRSAREVGEYIAMLVNMFNPSTIVIGGVVAGAGELYLAEVRQRVYELSLPLATRDLTIVRSEDDIREPLRGGAEMAREQLFEVTFGRWFIDGRPSIEAMSRQLAS